MPDPSVPSRPDLASGWHLAEEGGAVGPLRPDELVDLIEAGAGVAAVVFGPGLADWTEARAVPDLLAELRRRAAPRPLAPPPAAPILVHEILGHEMQYVEILLRPDEEIVAEAGSLMFMTEGVEMDTVLGGPGGGRGLGGRLRAVWRRLLTGESLFMTRFANGGALPETVAFAAPYPGKIVPMDLRELGGELVCQKDAFVCASTGVEIAIAFQRRIGVGLFGGEGFVMQRLVGDGTAMIHCGGSLMTRDLAAGEVLRLDSGCLVAMTPSIDYDVEFIGGVKNALFGGEGLFFATLTGPGRVWCQSLPFARLAHRVRTGGRRLGGESSFLPRFIRGR